MSCMSMCVSHNVIIQGSTPTLVLYLNYDISSPKTEEEEQYKDYYDVVLVIQYGLKDYCYYRNDEMTIIPARACEGARIAQENCCGCYIYVDLKEEDTIKFKRQVSIQIIARDKNTGAVLETFEEKINIARKLDKRVV